MNTNQKPSLRFQKALSSACVPASLAWLTWLTWLTMSPLLLNGCQTTGTSASVETVATAPSGISAEQEAVLQEYSDGESEYVGFYNNFEYRATLKNSSVRQALLELLAQYYQWDSEKLLSERNKSLQEMASETEVFLSFYTPDRRNDNLTDPKSIWKIYLDVGDRRYEGKPRKLRRNLAELQALYPYHTRWNTPYAVVFPIPTSAIETQISVVTVTGPLGTRSVRFKPIH